MPTKLVALAYPLMDVLVLGVLVRLMVANGPRAVGFALLVLGFLAQLVADSIYGWQLLHGGYVKGALRHRLGDLLRAAGRQRAASVHPGAVRAPRRADVSTHRQAHRAARCCSPGSPGAPAHPCSVGNESRRRGFGCRVGGAVRWS